jgi:hypothetical protein
LALSVPLRRFTPRVGGGSAFYVSLHLRTMKYLFASVGLVVLLFQTSCSTQRAISNYWGDGEIVAMPDGGFWQGGGGYEVRFKRVRLDHPIDLTFHFHGLPKNGWRKEIYFAIEGPQQLEWRNAGSHAKPPFIEDLRGTLALTLKDEDGHVILEYKHKLSEFIWSGGSGAQWLYDLSKVYFISDSRKKYVLEVSIDPDTVLKDYEGYVLIRSGGHEGISIGF